VNILFFIRFEVFTAVTMKICVFWDVTPCGSCIYNIVIGFRRVEGKRTHHDKREADRSQYPGTTKQRYREVVGKSSIADGNE
jgi:hypothetical protein